MELSEAITSFLARSLDGLLVALFFDSMLKVCFNLKTPPSVILVQLLNANNSVHCIP